ncbi:YafY family protein [Promicromonospora sukumoe]|uniref:Proteasome accessory factor C n=1 Tax=Promicromonospora sukumoe TaxID=88382 RepID=A0A7W3J891_9MICO|nr:WYL domain-containing protein [Promicromonospora sukumoe]MBA8808081.1 proteasome accessory factor C [Promicromonospora sukumoe]
MAERADDRLLRLLGIVAYLDGAGPVSIADLAGRFGTTPAQIQKDVDALWVSGTPGYWPDDLIDFDAASIDRGVVHLTEARGMTRPLRLGTREAIALVAALRAMKATDAVQADPARSAVVESALRKLTDATGEAASAVDVRLAPGGDRQVVAAISSALTNRHRLRIRYVTSSDVVSEREVDPVRLHTQDEFAYLAAWCYRADAPRTFRVDRILEATETDVPVQAHPGDATGEIDFAALFAGGSSPLATIRFAPRARWFAEEVPVESVRNLPDGDFEVTLRVTNPGWLRSSLIRLAPLVRSVSPGVLADDVAGAANGALALYGVGDAATSADHH